MANKTTTPDDDTTTTSTNPNDKDVGKTSEDDKSPTSADRGRKQEGSEPDDDEDDKPKSEGTANAEVEAGMSEADKSRHQYQTTRLPGEVPVNEAQLNASYKPVEAKRIETSGARKINFDTPTGARPEEVAQDYPRPQGNTGVQAVRGTGQDVISDRLAERDGARNRQFQQDQEAAQRTTIMQREEAQRAAERTNREQRDPNQRQRMNAVGEVQTERLPRTGDRDVGTDTRSQEGKGKTASKDVQTPPVKDSSTKK